MTTSSSSAWAPMLAPRARYHTARNGVSLSSHSHTRAAAISLRLIHHARNVREYLHPRNPPEPMKLSYSPSEQTRFEDGADESKPASKRTKERMSTRTPGMPSERDRATAIFERKRGGGGRHIG